MGNKKRKREGDHSLAVIAPGEPSDASRADSVTCTKTTEISLSPGENLIVKLNGKNLKVKIEYDGNKVRNVTEGMKSYDCVKVDREDSSAVFLFPQRNRRDYFPFLELPAELRTAIYELLFRNKVSYAKSKMHHKKPITQARIFMKINNDIKHGEKQPPCGLPFCNKQILNECIPCLMANKTFVFTEVKPLESFFLSIGTAGRVNLEKLVIREAITEYECFKGFRWTNRLLDCQKLRYLDLDFKGIGSPEDIDELASANPFLKQLSEQNGAFPHLEDLWIRYALPETIDRFRYLLRGEDQPMKKGKNRMV